MTSAVYSDGRSYQYTYDAVGNRLSQTITIGGVTASTTYAYDAANRLIAVDVVPYAWDNNPLKTIGGAAATCSMTASALTPTTLPTAWFLSVTRHP